MDHSALSEAQQQQQQQPQQQQQEQQDPQQAAYAQSYAAYYAAYHHQNHDPSQYQQQQYGASAYPHNHYHQYYYPAQDSSSAYYQAVPTPPEIAGVGPSNPSQIYGNVSVAATPPQDQQHGLNPASATATAAALSQLSQLADTMDWASAVANRHWHENGSRGRGRSSNRGGGRRGEVSFRDGGGGRGNFNHQPSAFCGRGRGRGLTGRGRGRKSYQSGEQSLAQAPPASVLQRRPVPQVVWCDICRVDCNSLEILEQHKSGKRHKKTVQRVDEIQKQQRLFDEMQAKVMPDPALQTKEVYQSSSVMGITPNAAGLSAQLGDATKVSIAPEIMPSAVFSAVQVDGTKTAEGQTNIVKEEMATEASPSDAPLAEGSLAEGHPKFGVSDRFDGRRGGLKRQMTRFGRGGKRLKSAPRNQPRVCTVCNIMCDTLAVFECHLSGKKHMSKIKRFQGHGSVYGPITVYIPPNQPLTYPTNGQEPLFYGFKCHEMLRQEASGDLNGLQVGNYGGLRHYLSEQTRDADIGGPNSQEMENLDYREGEFVAAEGLNLDNTVTQDTIALDSEVEDPSMAPLAFAYQTNSEEVPFTTGEYMIPIPEIGDRLGDDVRLPGLGAADVEELGPNTEELA